MTKDRLKKQIIDTLISYTSTFDGLSPTQVEDMKAAILSGMSLVASFLAKHDGSKEITAQFVESAVAEVGSELGWEADKIARREKL